MNRDILLFAVTCIEGITENLGISGTSAYELLTAKSDLLDSYIVTLYDTLHTQSKEYIIDELVDLMRHEGLLG